MFIVLKRESTCVGGLEGDVVIAQMGHLRRGGAEWLSRSEQ